MSGHPDRFSAQYKTKKSRSKRITEVADPFEPICTGSARCDQAGLQEVVTEPPPSSHGQEAIEEWGFGFKAGCVAHVKLVGGLVLKDLLSRGSASGIALRTGG